MKVNEIVYNRYDVNNLINVYEKAKIEIENAKKVDDILKVRNIVVEEYAKLDTAYNLAYIRWSQNTVSEFYCAEKRYYEENIPLISTAETNYYKTILNSQFLNELKEKIPSVLFDIYEYKLISNSPIISEDIINENLISSEYSDFMSALTVEFNGEEIPFTVLKKYMQSDDALIRKSAYFALGNRLEKDSEFLNSNFDKLVKVRTEMAKKIGFKDFVKLGYYRMNRIGYSYKDIKKFRQGVIEFIVPAVNRIKRKIYDKLLIFSPKLYDNDAVLNDGDVEPIFNGKELFNKGATIYAKMSSETEKFFNFMIESEAFDCLSRVNKWGGGYQTDLKDYKTPFILANFNGSSADVDVLTHEGGHAYASYLMFKNNADVELGLPFMDVAETHSMTMEFLCYKYVDEIFKEKSNKYKLKHFVDSFTFIPYGVMVDDFQENVYRNYEISCENRNQLWQKLEKIYRPYMDSDGIPYLEKGTRWQYQMHIYESPFYYIDYALAQVVALQFLFMSQEDYDKAFTKYNEFISYGATLPFVDLLNKIGLKSPFDVNTLKEIAEKSIFLFDSLSKYD